MKGFSRKKSSFWPVRIFLLVPALFLFNGSALSNTLSDTLERGTVRCGVNADLPGFSQQNSLGEFSGFDIDFCRAVSAVIFGTPDNVDYTPVSAIERMEALASGRFDILSRNTTVTLGRTLEFGDYAGITFYDGQGFMVNKSSGIRSALELDNQTICVGNGTTTDLNAFDFFSESEMRYRPVGFDDTADAAKAYAEGDCVAFTTDRSALAAQRTSLDTPDAHLVLPEVISKEPLGPMVRYGDDQWLNITRWTLACLINAEELRITQDKVASLSTAASPPSIRRLLGVEGDAGEMLGLDSDWCASAIATVGNYQEIYNRHIGPDTPIGLERGVNDIWTNGGLLYSPPVR